VDVIDVKGRPEAQFEGDDTPPVRVLAHDIFPPAVPSGLQAAFSGVGQQPFIDLIWMPDTDPDLAGYNVYRREAGGPEQRINSEPVKTPAFRDTKLVPGHSYIYSVSAVDVRGNESVRSAETSERVP
jgi:fibronectin type 3 domain-containing protein